MARSELHQNEAFLSELLSIDSIRVWSFLVTVFGDLAQEDVLELPGSLLNQLCLRINIKPEALRVALHRLRKDGWIESIRSGRTSQYKLSAYGLEETLRVSPRIYGPVPKTDTHCVLCVHAEDSFSDQTGGIPIAPRTSLYSTVAASKDSSASLQTELLTEELPTWVIDKFLPEELRKNTERLDTAFSHLLKQFHTGQLVGQSLDSLDQLASRSLILHHWRRIALKDILWSEMTLNTNSVGRRCYLSANALLEQIPRARLIHSLNLVA